MDTVEQLLKRQAELEGAMKQPGGARVTEEHELLSVRQRLGAITAGVLIVSPSVPTLRCSLADFAATSPPRRKAVR